MRPVFALTAAAALGVFAPPAAAQGKGGPAVEIRLKSVNDLLDYAEYVGGLVGQEEQAKQGAALVRAFAGEKGIEGVDPKRPFGLYATVTPNVADSLVVAMVPIADEEAFLGLLRNRLSLEPKKGDDGVYSVKVPKVEPTVYFTFGKGYVFATIRDKKALGGKAIADPKAFFPANDPSVVSVAVHIDRIPEDVRKTLFGQFELQLNQEKEKKNPGDSPAQHKLKGVLLDGFAAAAHSVVTGGRTLAARLLVDPKQDDLALDVTLTAADGSDLEKTLKSASGRKSLAAAAAAVKNPVIAGSVSARLPAGVVEKLGPLVDDIFKDAVGSAKPQDRDAAKKVLDAIAPTVKAGVAEFGGAMTGPDVEGHYKAVVAVRVKEGEGIEKVAKEFAPFLADKLTAEFDTAKVAGKPLHKVVAPNPEAKRVFGTEAAWWVIGDDISVISSEPDGAEAKRVAAAMPVAGDIIRLEVSAAAAAVAFEKQLKSDEVKGLVTDVFDGKSPQGRDTVLFTVTGGEKLNAKLVVKGRAVKLAAAMDKARKKGE